MTSYDTMDDIDAQLAAQGRQRSGSTHSDGRLGGSVQARISELELENKLLKNEVESLNDEMTSVLRRAKDAQEGCCSAHHLPTSA